MEGPPERGAEARSAEGGGSAEGRCNPSPVGESGANFSRKINVEIAHLSAFLQAVTVSSAVTTRQD